MGKIKFMATHGVAVLTGAAMCCAAFTANAGVMFYTDQTAFLAATSSTTLVDFEGIVGDTGSVAGDPITLGDVSVSTTGTDIAILTGKDSGSGNPFDSALVASGNGTPLQIDFADAFSNVWTAAGGDFGDSDSAGSTGVLRLFGLGNTLLDTQNVTVADMGAGIPRTFFGWTTDGGDVIERIEFDMVGNFEVVDDIRFGSAAAVVAVAEPGMLALFGLGLAGIGIARRKRTV